LRDLAGVTADGTLLDGEVVALVDGVPSFEAVADSARHARAQLSFVVFDVPVSGGEVITSSPLAERRAVLQDLDLPACATRSQVFTDGAALLDVTRRRGLEGVVAKRDTSPYRPGVRSPDWVKLAHRRTRTALVGGWRADATSSSRAASLLLGARDADGALRFLGRAGSGLSASLAARVATALEAHPVARSPFDDPVPATARRDARWCEPVVVVQIAYRERTTGGVLRHPVVLGLRDDAVPDAWEQP
jgi:bifunctional non-homologous end joining protein LigD